MHFEDDDDVDREPFNDPSPAPELNDQLATLCDALAQNGLTKVEVFYQRKAKKSTITGCLYRPKDIRVARTLEETLRNLAEGYFQRAFDPDGTAREITTTAAGEQPSRAPTNRPRYPPTARQGTLTLYPGQKQARLSDAERCPEIETGPCRTFRVPARLRKVLAALGITTLRVSFTLCEHVGHITKLTTQPVPIQIEDALRQDLAAFIFTHLPTSLISKNIGCELSTQGIGTVDIEVEDSRAVPTLDWLTKGTTNQVTRWRVGHDDCPTSSVYPCERQDELNDHESYQESRSG